MGIKQTTTTIENPIQGNVVFYQNWLPPLESGNYTLTVEQQVSSGKDGKIKEQTYQNTRDFAVTGPQFTIDQSCISSVYPPQNASGEYGNVLPHVCFTVDSLPWDRSAGAHTQSGSIDNVAPWLGILVITSGDVTTDGLRCEIKQIKLIELLDKKYQAAGSQGKLPDNFLFSGFPGEKNNDLEYGQKWDDPCTVVDIPVELFNQLAPCYDDLQWLGHVREVQAGSHSAMYLTKLQSISDEKRPPRFSTVIGNRFPSKGSQNTALLVSFENYAGFLPDKNGNSRIDKGITHVRMVLFMQWNFYAVSENETFSGYLTHLNKNDPENMTGFLQLAPQDINDKPDQDTGEKPDKEIIGLVNNAFAMGYVPLNHHTRQGDNTVSWYRGPFLPFDEHDQIELPVNNPDSCTAYNPDTGMFDVSYAAAYQLGRLLALQNNSFADTLHGWKRSNLHDAISEQQQEAIRTSLREITYRHEKSANESIKSISHLLISSLKCVLEKFTEPLKNNRTNDNE